MVEYRDGRECGGGKDCGGCFDGKVRIVAWRRPAERENLTLQFWTTRSSNSGMIVKVHIMLFSGYRSNAEHCPIIKIGVQRDPINHTRDVLQLLIVLFLLILVLFLVFILFLLNGFSSFSNLVFSLSIDFIILH